MSRHNRNFNQQPSQRPAHQQVATHPVAVEESVHEAEQDIVRVPSAATEGQSETDAMDADPDRHEAQAPITDTDPVPGETTDIPEGVDVEEFNGFEDIGTRPSRHVGRAQEMVQERAIQAPVVINRTEAEQLAYDNELVPIIPRITRMRNSVNGQWYNLVKSQEQWVPRSVAEHFRSKGLL